MCVSTAREHASNRPRHRRAATQQVGRQLQEAHRPRQTDVVYISTRSLSSPSPVASSTGNRTDRATLTRSGDRNYIYIYRNSSVHNGSKSVSCDKGTLAVRSSLTQRRMIITDRDRLRRHDNIVTIGSGVKMCTPTRRPESPDAGHNSIHGHGGAGHGYHVLLKRVSAFTRHATRSCRFHTDHSPTQTRRKGDTSPPTDTESGRPAALHKAGAPRG